MSRLPSRVPQLSPDPRNFSDPDPDAQRRFEELFAEVARRVMALAPTVDTSSGDLTLGFSNGLTTISGVRSRVDMATFNVWRGSVTFDKPFLTPPIVLLTAAEPNQTQHDLVDYLGATLFDVTVAGFQFRVSAVSNIGAALLYFRAEGLRAP